MKRLKKKKKKEKKKRKKKRKKRKEQKTFDIYTLGHDQSFKPFIALSLCL